MTLGRTIEQTTADGIRTIYSYDDHNYQNTFIEKWSEDTLYKDEKEPHKGNSL